MPQSPVSEVDVLRETVRHNEKGIDTLTADLKEFRKEVNGKFERVDSKLEAINNRFEAINSKFETTNKTIDTKFEAINKTCQRQV